VILQVKNRMCASSILCHPTILVKVGWKLTA
jgi:hypothetical protein